IGVKDSAVRDTLRTALRDKTREFEEARRCLRDLRTHRETLAKPSVARRLKALEQTLTRKPLSVVETNKALKEAGSKVVINPETAELTIYWHHAPEQPTEAGPFYSRHFTRFDEVPGGYSAKRDTGVTSRKAGR